MGEKLKKRYFSGSAKVFRALRQNVASPLSLLLLGLFLFTHAVAVNDELQVSHWPEQAKKTTELSVDGRCDLQAEAASWREFRNGRGGAENRHINKQEVRTLHREVSVALSKDSPTLHSFSAPPILSSASPCEAPESPRPPPAPSSQQG